MSRITLSRILIVSFLENLAYSSLYHFLRAIYLLCDLPRLIMKRFLVELTSLFVFHEVIVLNGEFS